MSVTSTQTIPVDGQLKIAGRMPALGKELLLGNTYNEGTRSNITIKMVSRINKLLGTYSKVHEARIAKDISDVISHIKSSEDNARMKHPSYSQLGTDPAKVFKTIYMNSKHIALEFGQLMKEGVVEIGAETAHDEQKIKEQREKASHKIWRLGFELRLIRGIAKNESNEHLINEKLAEVVERFAFLMETDMKVFCDVHGIDYNHAIIIPPPITTSPK